MQSLQIRLHVETLWPPPQYCDNRPVAQATVSTNQDGRERGQHTNLFLTVVSLRNILKYFTGLTCRARGQRSLHSRKTVCGIHPSRQE
jgi:hypothetical protein